MIRKVELDFERANVVNNIRLLYIDLYDRGRVDNVKDFAEQIGVGKSTAEGWLREGHTPQPDFRRKIEITFGLKEGSLKDDIHPMIENWDERYYNSNGAKPSLRGHKYEVAEETSMMVAETDSDIISRILSYSQDERRELLMEIRQELRERIDKNLLKGCPKLFEIGFGY